MSTPSISDARRLAAETVAVGGIFPKPLTNLLNLVDAVQTAPAAPNPAAKLLAAAVDGKASSPAEIAKLVSEAAKAEQEANYLRQLQQQVARDAMRQFSVELHAGAAEKILDSIRPQFHELAQQLADAKAVIDLNWTAEHIANAASPEETAAWRALPSLVARVDKFAALVAVFGRLGDFGVLEQPQHGVHNELVGLRDEALFLTGSDPWRASDLINARRADWRTSPWVRLPLRLNTLDVARERLRVLCESAFDAIESARGVHGRITDDGWKQDPRRQNPFARAEAAQA